MKKRKVVSATTAAYDEASSGSSDSDEEDHDESDVDDDSPTMKNQLEPVDSDEEDSDGDSDSESDLNHHRKGLEDSESSGDEEEMDEKRRSSSDRGQQAESGEDEDVLLSEEENDDDDDDEADLPLQERIQRKEARGLSLQKQRERKRSALEIASERLAKYKKYKKEGVSSQRPDNDSTGDDDGGPQKKKKKSKHAPTEASSKRGDFYRRGAPRLNESGVGVEIGARRYKPLDPRTSSLSGHLNEEQFEKNYEFLQDMRTKEISQLKKKIVARKSTGKKGKRMRRQLDVSVADGSVEEDEDRLRQLKQEKADFERRKVVRAAKQSVKKKIQTEVEEGKRGAFFLKRKEKKQLEFEAKMEELRKQRGGHKAVEKALAKRRQKAKSRDAGLFAK